MTRFGPSALLIAAVLAATAAPARGDDAQEVELKDCPAAVQKTLRAESRGGTIEVVSKETDDDKTSYWADVVIAGKSFGIGVDEDGTLTEFGLQVDDHEIGLTDCPAAVQATIRAEATKTRAIDVHRETRLGATVYVTTVGVGEKQYEIRVAEDGTLTEKVLLIDEVEVELDACPDAVQKVFKEESKGGEVQGIIKSNGLGKRVYLTHIAVEGKTYVVEVAEDGLLLYKTLSEDE